MNSRIHNFLLHPITQAASGAFIAGLLGFILAVFVGSFFITNHLYLMLAGGAGAFAMSFWGVRSQMKMVNCKQYKFDSTSMLVSTAGSMLLFAATLSIFGLSEGGFSLATAIAFGLFTGVTLQVAKMRCRSCGDKDTSETAPGNDKK